MSLKIWQLCTRKDFNFVVFTYTKYEVTKGQVFDTTIVAPYCLARSQNDDFCIYRPKWILTISKTSSCRFFVNFQIFPTTYSTFMNSRRKRLKVSLAIFGLGVFTSQCTFEENSNVECPRGGGGGKVVGGGAATAWEMCLAQDLEGNLHNSRPGANSDIPHP
jgi:hypothetical protein